MDKTYEKQKRHHRRKTRAYNICKHMAGGTSLTIDEWLDKREKEIKLLKMTEGEL